MTQAIYEPFQTVHRPRPLVHKVNGLKIELFTTQTQAGQGFEPSGERVNSYLKEKYEIREKRENRENRHTHTYLTRPIFSDFSDAGECYR